MEESFWIRQFQPEMGSPGAPKGPPEHLEARNEALELLEAPSGALGSLEALWDVPDTNLVHFSCSEHRCGSR